MSTLTSLAYTTYDIFDSTVNGNGMSSKDIGMAIVISGVGGSAGGKFVKGMVKRILS